MGGDRWPQIFIIIENLQQPWGQIYYDILFEQLKDIKGREWQFWQCFSLSNSFPLGLFNEKSLAVEPNEKW